jgi:hypothetical protein
MYKVIVGKLGRHRQLGIPTYKWNDDIKAELKE